VILVAALIAALVLPAAAHAETKVARSGAVEARLSWREAGAMEVRNLRLRVVREGARAYDARVRTGECGGSSCRPAGEEPLRVTDLDGDAEPEVVLDVFSGGAHCCVVTRVLDWTGTEYGLVDRNFRDAGYELRDLDGDGVPEFRSADARFAYSFSSYATSGMPLQALRLRSGRFEDVTAAFPELIRRDAGEWERRYRSRRNRSDGEQLGVLAAWAADRYRLGERAAMLGFLRAELAAGRLRGPEGGRRYVSRLDRFLRRLGYAPAAG
jgi:hypothetical protein